MFTYFQERNPSSVSLMDVIAGLLTPVTGRNTLMSTHLTNHTIVKCGAVISPTLIHPLSENI